MVGLAHTGLEIQNLTTTTSGIAELLLPGGQDKNISSTFPHSAIFSV